MALYTQAENDKLAQLLNTSTAKEAEFQAEVQRNIAIKNAGSMPGPGGMTLYSYGGSLMPAANYNTILNASNQSVELFKQNAITAKNAYDSYKLFLVDSYQLAFNTANPTAAVQIAAGQAQAAADLAIATAQGKAATVEITAKAELEARNATFAAKNKQIILYVGIALTVIIVAAFVYFKFSRKVKP